MELESLRAFVTVCQERKMTRAAEKLFMSKQTLSAIIKKTESEMGVVLLERKNYGVELTPAGKCFFDYALRMLTLWEQCRASMEQICAEQRIRLRVGFAYMSWNLWNRDLQEQFHRENPDIELEVWQDMSKHLLVQMDEERCDVVITCMQQEQYGKYQHRTLSDARMLLVMSENDPLAALDVVTPKALSGRLVIYPDSGAAYLHRFAEAMAAAGFPIRTELAIGGSFLHTLGMVRESGGVKLTNDVYQNTVPPIAGYTVRELRAGDGANLPPISISALIRAQAPEAAQRFAAFFGRVLRERKE